jgi:hypothetical protein
MIIWVSTNPALFSKSISPWGEKGSSTPFKLLVFDIISSGVILFSSLHFQFVIVVERRHDVLEPRVVAPDLFEPDEAPAPVKGIEYFVDQILPKFGGDELNRIVRNYEIRFCEIV